MTYRDVTFKAAVDFGHTTFKGDVDFKGSPCPPGFIPESSETVTFEGPVSFNQVVFDGTPNFKDATFKDSSEFDSTTFGGPVCFDDASFNFLTFDPRPIPREFLPPKANVIRSYLTWDRVKDTFPRPGILFATDKTDVYGAWENFFASAGNHVDARKIRTIIQRQELQIWIEVIAGSFAGWSLLFAPLYYWRFRRDRRSPVPHHAGKVLLFSLDVISPSIRPWKFDWTKDGGLPVHQVVVFTAVESAIGWILLGLGSAVAVAYMVA